MKWYKQVIFPISVVLFAILVTWILHGKISSPIYFKSDTVSLEYHSQLSILNTNNMKKCLLVYPESAADSVATFLAENGIITLVSYAKEGGFFNISIFHYVAFKEELSDKVKAQLHNYIKEK